MVSLTNFRSVGELSIELDNAGALSGDKSTGQLVADVEAAEHTHYTDNGSKFSQGHHKKYHLNPTQLAPQQAQQAEKCFLGGAASAKQAASREHFEIRWNNLTYQVEPKWYHQKWASLTTGTQPEGKKMILNGLNGSVRSGQVTAILGPSGAGKTSLLGCLTGKNKSGVSGSIQVMSGRQEPMSTCTIPQKGK